MKQYDTFSVDRKKKCSCAVFSVFVQLHAFFQSDRHCGIAVLRIKRLGEKIEQRRILLLWPQ